jgi:hypothetical protein
MGQRPAFVQTCPTGTGEYLIPVLIDLGSGQYNGNQDIRNFFRSTIAHNTVEIGEESQAKIVLDMGSTSLFKIDTSFVIEKI